MKVEFLKKSIAVSLTLLTLTGSVFGIKKGTSPQLSNNLVNNKTFVPKSKIPGRAKSISYKDYKNNEEKMVIYEVYKPMGFCGLLDIILKFFNLR